MLTKIINVKNLGVFADFSFDARLPPFKAVNVIYGPNGSGKTTLSRFFAALKDGAHPDHPELRYRLECNDGQLSDGSPCHHKIRVFNADFIQANINRVQGSMRHILLLGEESKIISDEIKAEELTVKSRREQIISLEKEISKGGDARGKLFSQIAKTIGEATSGSITRTYRKTNAEAAYKRVGKAEVLGDTEIAQHRATVRQDHLEAIPATDLSFSIPIDDFIQRAKSLLQRSAQADVIARLAAHPDISAWVERGLSLHQSHSSRTCEFCQQLLPLDRLEVIGRHFSQDDQILKQEIEALIQELTLSSDKIRSFSTPDPARLFSEMREAYSTHRDNLDTELQQLEAHIFQVIHELQRKLTLRTTAYDADFSHNLPAAYNVAQAMIRLLEAHNAKSNEFDIAKLKAERALEDHYLKELEPDVQKHDDALGKLNAALIALREGSAELPDPRSLEALETSISIKRAQISSTHKGGEELTAKLRTFLGRSELTFVSGDDGYKVYRRGKTAKGLSEGERTAIAFIYFLVHLQEEGFDVKDGIVVIDDPISSLDSSSIYQAFSFLKNSVSDAKQVFLLTHNYDFLRLILNWRQFASNNKKTSYYMLLCTEADGVRVSSIIELDKLLREHPTEYHFLFKTLYEFKSDGSIAASYHIPNIARKVLETFLSFHAPSKESLYIKLEAIAFDKDKKTSIYKFTNDQSHYNSGGFDPALVPETQNNTAYLLEMIKSLAPSHYAGLVNSFTTAEAA